MRLRALKEFNHGSIDQHYLPGQVFTISDGDGADLVKAGLAEAAPASAIPTPTATPAPTAAQPEGRETKPDPAAKVITSKSTK